MSITKVDRKFEKGLVLLVGKKGILGDTIVDGISMHTAQCLANRIHYLDSAVIEESDDIIYLVGHGGANEQTIDGRKMDEVAYLLLKSGYRGKQPIYVTSCHASVLVDNISIVTELKNKLEKQLNCPVCIESDCNGASIFIYNQDKIEMWVVNSDTNTLNGFFSQNLFLLFYDYYFKFQRKKYDKYLNDVQGLKKSLIKKYYKDGDVFMDIDGRIYWKPLTTIFSPIVSLIVCSILFLINYFYKVDYLTYFLLVEFIIGCLALVWWIKREDHWISMLLYKGMFLNVIIHTISKASIVLFSDIYSYQFIICLIVIVVDLIIFLYRFAKNL